MCGDQEGPTIFEEKHPIARNSHTCCECGSNINPGEKYQLVKGLWDGEWSKFKTCSVCEKIGDTARAEGDCISYGELYGEIGYCFEEVINQG